jgi:acyl carrier protein
MSNYEESLRITCELLRRHVDESQPIRPSDHIQNDLGLDSLSVMELVDGVESRFGVNIPQEKFEQIATVEDVARLVLSLQSDGEVDVPPHVQPRLRPSGEG